ncbi:MAG: type II/IV secretion system protein [Candidatus Omnitrophica bacterium]|nr:type II/IV secretion system protein [Candidatus Omnitrophota bacterium]
MNKQYSEKVVNILTRNNMLTLEAKKTLLENLSSDADIVNLLLSEHGVSDFEILGSLSLELDIPPVNLSRMVIEDATRSVIPLKLQKKYNVVPVSKISNAITLAIVDPFDILAFDDIKTITGCEIHLMLTLEKHLHDFWGIKTPKTDSEANVLDESYEIDDADENLEVVQGKDQDETMDVTSESQTAPIVKIVSVIIAEAIKKRASDIHIEPQEKKLRVRFRIDGELFEAFELPKTNQNAVIARIKIMSSLDITENRLPQDGRFRVRVEGREVDFRVSVLPTAHGNKIVMRALDKKNLSVGLESLGFLPKTLTDFEKALENPFGIILITGPTGSGKSTTLYSVLNKINKPEINVITVEDPVEYQIPGITQVAVRQEIGLSFSSGLRSILRQTPDVILIGEIRDFETADIAIKSSLTGHLVLSTLHTNDAVGSITRLMNMKIEPFLIASSLVLTCAQRLLRKNCPSCREKIDMPLELRKSLENKYPVIKEYNDFYEGRGCGKCNNTGYYGRMATLETILIDDQLRRLITDNVGESKIREYLNTIGFKTLRENAMVKFAMGDTTLDEVYRVT